MDLLYFIAAIISSYFIGAIPTSVWVGKVFYGMDVRKQGSGNAGASNTFRVLGVKAGIPVLLFDVIKGWAATNFVYFIPALEPGSEIFITYQIILGVTAVLGHIFPIYIGFKGGKGIATLLGMVLAIHMYAALYCFCIFIVLLLITRYVSVSSMLATIAFPILIIYVFQANQNSLLVFAFSVTLLVILTHQKNIQRLFKGEENKANLLKWKNKD